METSNYAWQANLMDLYYVYILSSISNPAKRYTGFTTNLEKRLKDHNSEKSPHTSKYIPWKIEVAIIFSEQSKALRYEKYLKAHSGRAYSSKHFLNS